MSTLYPPDVIESLKSKWATPSGSRKPRPPLPTDRTINRTAVHLLPCKLLKGRRPPGSVSINCFGPGRQRRESPLSNKDRAVLFREPRELSVAELRRLAPAAEFVRSLICVEQSPKGDWLTSGCYDTGSNWWKFNRHEVSGGRPPPDGLTISSYGPGELTFSQGARTYSSAFVLDTYTQPPTVFCTTVLSLIFLPMQKTSYIKRQSKI